MLVNNETFREDYVGDGAAYIFTISFPFLDNSHIEVWTKSGTDDPVKLTLDTDYTLEGAGEASGGTATLTVVPASGLIITIVRNIPFTQLYAYATLDKFPSASHENCLAKVTMMCQQLKETLSRAVVSEITDPNPVSYGDILNQREAAEDAAIAAGAAQLAAEIAQGLAEVAQAAAEAAAASVPSDALRPADISVTVQAFDADIVKADAVFPLPTADLTATGIIIQRSCGETIGMPWLCRIGTDGYLYLADADAASTMPVRCVSLGSGVLNDVVNVLLLGFLRVNSWTWTPGLPIYASTDPGMWTQTAPSGTGDQVQIVGYALSATLVFVCPSPVVIEVA